MTNCLQQIRPAGWNPAEGITGANFGNSALVAIHATVVTHLQEQRAIPKAVAALHTLCTTNTELLVDGVLVVGVLYEAALDGCGWTQTIFGARVEVVRFRLEVAR